MKRLLFLFFVLFLVSFVGGTYVPPDRESVNFTLGLEAYTPPDRESVNFTLGEVIDTTPPEVSLDFPTDNSWQALTTITFKGTPYEESGTIDNCSLWTNESGWSLKQTNDTCMDEASCSITDTLTEGSFIWNFECCDNSNNCGSNTTGNFTVNIDTTYPSIYFVDPTTNSSNYSQSYITANVSASDTNLDTINITTYNYSDGSKLNSSDCASSPCFVNFTGFEDGNISLNATANDTAGNLNYTETRTILLDTTGPTWVDIPANATLEYMIESLNADFNASDEWVDVDSYFTNDSVNFIMNSGTGVLENNTNLSVGTHIVNVSVNDTLSNINSVLYQATVQDTLAPSISAPDNATLEFKTDSLEVTFNATDFSALGNWFVDDTTNFSINSSGTLVNITELALGTYDINVSINDTYNNINSTIYGVTVHDTIYPYWDDNGTNASDSTKFNQTVYFNVTLHDLAGGFQIFSYYNGSEWINDTAASWSSPADLLETRILNATRGMTVSWYWWFNDSASNINETDVWSITVNNTIPVASSVNITSSDSLNRTNGTLTGSWSYSDIDGDIETDNETQWYRNTGEVIDLQNFTSVDPNNLTRGESWIFGVRVYDDYDWSIWVNSSAFVIENAEPEITLNYPANNSIDQDLATTLNATVCDLDGDNVNVAFYQNNTSLLSIVTLRDNLVNTLFGGESSKILTFSQAGNQSDYLKISDHANVTSSTFSLTGLLNYVSTLWQTTTQSNFDEGNYSQTYYNTSFVKLNATYVTGNYTSKIFNANTSRQWDNISWTQGGYYQQGLPDSQAIESGLEGINMTGNIGLWHLNENSGINAPDTSGEGNNGTLINMEDSDWVAGKLDNALQFDGVDEYVDCGNIFDFERTDSFSVEAWKQTSDSAGTIISRRIGSPSFRGWIVNNVNEKISFNLANNNVIINRLTMRTVSSFNDNIFHHIVVTYNGSSDPSGVHIYVDGVDEALTTVIDSLTATIKTTADCNIGSYDDGTDIWNGTLDEIAVWNRTLSADEILDIYKRGALKLNLTVRSCDDSTCSGESWTDINVSSPQNLSVINNTYFQYKYEFETDNISYSPELYNVTVSYTEYYYPTNVTLNIGNDSVLEWNQTGVFNYTTIVNDSNTTPTFTSKLNSILENCSCSGCVHDTTTETCKIPFVLNSETAGEINISDINITYDLREGDFTYLWTGLLPNTTYGWFVRANDSTAGVNSSIWYFTTWIYPEVRLNAPVNGYHTNITETVTFNCTANGNMSLSNVSLYLTDSSNSSFALNETNSSLNDIHSTDVIFTKTIVEGNYTWNCEACDNQSHCSFASENWSFTSGYIGLRLDGTDDNQSYEYRTTANITTGANYINIYDDTGRYRNELSPFDYFIDLLRQNKFNDSTTWKNISSGTTARVDLAGKDELYTTTLNVTGIGDPENVTLTYDDTNNIFFPGILTGRELYQPKIIVSGTPYNIYNLTFDSAESKTIYVNYSNQGDVLNRNGTLNFTMTGFDLDIGNEFVFNDNFTNGTSASGGTYTENMSLLTEIDDFGDNDSSRWTDDGDGSISIVNKDYLRMYMACGSGCEKNGYFYYNYEDLDLRKLQQFKTNLSYKGSVGCDRTYEEGIVQAWIYLTDGTNNVDLYYDILSQPASGYCKDWQQTWITNEQIDLNVIKRSETEIDVYYGDTFYGTESISNLDNTKRQYLQFRSYVYLALGANLNYAEFKLYNLSVAGISLKNNNSTYPSNIYQNYTSNSLNITPTDVRRITLNATVYNPDNTTINYYLSNDNGTTYEQVINGVTHSMTSDGKNVSAIFEVQTTNNSITPIVYSYFVKTVSTELSSLIIDPGDNALSQVNYSVLNATTTPTYYIGNDTGINVYINNSCNETDCLIPITFFSGSGGIIELSNFNLTQDINPIILNTVYIDGNIINLTSTGHVNLTDLKFDYYGEKNITVNAETGGLDINRTMFVFYSPFNITIIPSGIDYWDISPNIYDYVQNDITPFGNADGNGNPFFLLNLTTWDHPTDVYIRYNESVNTCQITTFEGYNFSSSAAFNQTLNASGQILVENISNLNQNWNISTLTNINCAAYNDTLIIPYFCFHSLCTECVRTSDFDDNCRLIE